MPFEEFNDEYFDEQNQADQEADHLNKLRSIKTLQFSGKCGDLCSYRALDADGKVVIDKEGELPSVLGDGDYVRLKIDLATGQILNWKQLTDEGLLDTFGYE
jgi:hypothetical protein